MGYSLCRNSVHDRRNRELGERDLRHLSAIAQDNDPIGVTHQLLQFRRDNQQRQAIGAEGFNQANNFRMGADVDAAGRLIEDQELRFGQQPAGEQHLLLVAAGEKLDRLLGARVRIPSWRIKRSAISFCSRGGSAAASRAAPAGRERYFPHRGSGDNAVGFAILRTEADPEAGRLMRGAQGLRFAFDPRLPAVRRFNAEDHLGGFRASGTQQAGEAYNFARADLQVEWGDGSFLP